MENSINKASFQWKNVIRQQLMTGMIKSISEDKEASNAVTVLEMLE